KLGHENYSLLSTFPMREKKANLMDNNPARFQRTDQWLPVYSWLESLDRDEVVKSNEMKDWLAANAEVSEQLCSRHSHYHLMHYIKKCHVKILKRREKKKALEQRNQVTPVKFQPNSTPKPPALIPSDPAKDLPKDSDAYLAKRNEALQICEVSGV
ncbi:hypothetical protein RJ641_012409, partial [Dillenia turbinata]